MADSNSVAIALIGSVGVMLGAVLSAGASLFGSHVQRRADAQRAETEAAARAEDRAHTERMAASAQAEGKLLAWRTERLSSYARVLALGRSLLDSVDLALPDRLTVETALNPNVSLLPSEVVAEFSERTEELALIAGSDEAVQGAFDLLGGVKAADRAFRRQSAYLLGRLPDRDHSGSDAMSVAYAGYRRLQDAARKDLGVRESDG